MKNILRTILRKLFVAQGFQKIFQAINCWMQQATKLKRISVYQVLEKLKTEQYFQIFAWVSLGVVLVSTFTFVLGTFPEFQKEEDTGQPPPYPEAVLVMDVVGK